MIRSIKAVLVGVALGLTCGALSLVVELALASRHLPAVMEAAAGAGPEGLAVQVGRLYAPFIAVTGFVVGLLWQLRRVPSPGNPKSGSPP